MRALLFAKAPVVLMCIEESRYSHRAYLQLCSGESRLAPPGWGSTWSSGPGGRWRSGRRWSWCRGTARTRPPPGSSLQIAQRHHSSRRLSLVGWKAAGQDVLPARNGARTMAGRGVPLNEHVHQGAVSLFWERNGLNDQHLWSRQRRRQTSRTPGSRGGA